MKKLVSAIAASYEMPDFDLTWQDPENVKFYRHERHDERVFFWMDTLCVPRGPEHIHARASESLLFLYQRRSSREQRLWFSLVVRAKEGDFVPDSVLFGLGQHDDLCGAQLADR